MKLFTYLNIFPFGPAEATAVLGGGGGILVGGHVKSLVYLVVMRKSYVLLVPELLGLETGPDLKILSQSNVS